MQGGEKWKNQHKQNVKIYAETQSCARQRETRYILCVCVVCGVDGSKQKRHTTMRAARRTGLASKQFSVPVSTKNKVQTTAAHEYVKSRWRTQTHWRNKSG